MKPVHTTVLFVLLLTLYGCQEPSISNQSVAPTLQRDFANPASESIGDITTSPGGQSTPYPTITKQTFIPEYSLFANVKCHAWRITWPTYPAATDVNRIATVFSLQNGSLNSFHFLNSVSASTTYKTNFNLYYNAKLETANTLWDELIHSFGAGQNMETTWFYKTNYTAKTIEYMVKERPSLFEIYWQKASNFFTEFTYQSGDIFLYKLEKQKRYGGVRIVSMNPRIIEVYLTEPNN